MMWGREAEWTVLLGVLSRAWPGRRSRLPLKALGASYGVMTRWLSTVATPGAEAAAARAALASLSECTWP